MNTIVKRQVGWIGAIALGLLMQAAVADKIYVSSSIHSDIEVIDTDSNRMIRAIPQDDDPNYTVTAWQHRLLSIGKGGLSMQVVNPEGTRIYAISATPLYYGYIDHTELVVLDTKTDDVLYKIPLSCQPMFSAASFSNLINSSGTRLYVRCDDSRISIVDTVLNKEIAILPSSSVFTSEMLASGAYLYVRDYVSNDKLAVLDANTGSLTTTIQLDDGTFDNPYISRMSANGTRLYVLYPEMGSSSRNTIQIVNTQSNQLVDSINIPIESYTIRDMKANSAGTRLYLCAEKGVLVFNLISHTLETSIPMVNGLCSAIAINASGTRIYVAKDQPYELGRVIHVIDAESNQVASTISVNLGGTTRMVVVSSATITPISRTTARIFELNSQAKLPIVGGFGIGGTGRLSLLFQGSVPKTCTCPSITLRKYPSEEVIVNPSSSRGMMCDWYVNWSRYSGNWSAFPEDSWYVAHLSTESYLRSSSNTMDSVIMWNLPVGYYTASLDSPGCNEQGKLNIDMIEENSSSSAKLINVSANAMLPITSSVTVKGTGNIQTMFRGFKVAPCVDANLELKNSTSGALIASNDNWETDVNITAAKALPQYLQPIDSSDAGLLRQLGAQSITATLSSKNACQGDGVFGMDITP